MPKRELSYDEVETRQYERRLMRACFSVVKCWRENEGPLRGKNGKLKGKMKRRLRTVIKHASDLGVMYQY